MKAFIDEGWGIYKPFLELFTLEFFFKSSYLPGQNFSECLKVGFEASLFIFGLPIALAVGITVVYYTILLVGVGALLFYSNSHITGFPNIDHIFLPLLAAATQVFFVRRKGARLLPIGLTLAKWPAICVGAVTSGVVLFYCLFVWGHVFFRWLLTTP
jgi:hypothetical protein